TAALLSPLAAVGSEHYYQLAIWLALLSGALLFVLGLLRMGFLANFLSHPVISGFISGASILIMFSQLPHLLGLASLPTTPAQLLEQWQPVNSLVLVLGLLALAWLLYARSRLTAHLQRLGMAGALANILARLAPILVVVLGLLITVLWGLADRGVPVVGS